MKKLFAVAAFLLASSAAQAQYSFEYGGRTIRIDPDRGTVSIPGVYDNSGRKSRRSQDADRKSKQAPDQAKNDPVAPVTPPPAPAEQTPAPAANPLPEPAPATTANNGPGDTITALPPPSPTTPPALQDATPPAPRIPPPVVATAPVAAPVQKQQTPAPAPAAQAGNSPLGLWLTEEKEGQVRIEQCGANLCGYSVDSKSNQNGEQVLINMKPGKDKWSGRIYDPKTGSTYESTIALKGTDSLRVQGCAFGGMFCGGQTWSRVN
jgi:uncharacterized protein (DUF2147 family)